MTIAIARMAARLSHNRILDKRGIGVSRMRTAREFGIYIFVVLIIAALLGACGDSSDPSEQSRSSGDGSLAVQVHWIESPDRMAYASEAGFVCGGGPREVVTVEVYIFNKNNDLIKKSRSFPCLDGHGRVDGVPAGSERWVVLVGKNSNGHVTYCGQQDHIVVTAGNTTDSIEIDAAPFLPESLSLSPGDQQMGLFFEPVSGADTYHVYWQNTLGENGKIENVESGDSVMGLVNGITYYYRLVAANSGGESEPSAQVGATPSVPLPSAPADASASPGNSQVTIRFNSVEGAMSYNLYWKEGPEGGVDLETDHCIEGIVSPYVHDGLGNGTTYHYVVTAVGPGGQSAASAEVSATPQIPISGAPGDVSATAHSRKVIIQFSGVTGADGYNLHWGFDAQNLTEEISGIAPGYEHAGLSNGKTYYYAVSAYNTVGESGYSPVVSARPEFTAADVTMLHASDLEVNQGFGNAVAADGGYLVVGAPFADRDTVDVAGAVYIFRRTGLDSWDAGFKIVNPNVAVQEQDRFGISVDIDGDYAVIGANRENGGPAAAYVYRRTGTNIWEFAARLALEGMVAADFAYGERVAITGNDVIVGVPCQDYLSSNTGAAYIFHRNVDNSWSAAVPIIPSALQSGDLYGRAVDADGDLVIVGAGGGPGAAYIFKKLQSGEWYNEARLAPPGLGDQDWFGRHVAISGNRVAVSAEATDHGVEGDPDNKFQAGAVYVFQRSPGGSLWDQGTKIAAVTPFESGYFGKDVAIDGEALLVGARDSGIDTSAYLFRLVDQHWTLAATLKAPDSRYELDYYGESAALDGGFAIVGAYYRDVDGVDCPGAVFVH